MAGAIAAARRGPCYLGRVVKLSNVSPPARATLQREKANARQDDRGDWRVRRSRRRRGGGGDRAWRNGRCARPRRVRARRARRAAWRRTRCSSAASTSLARGAQRAMAEVTERFGRIDALLNIAGGFRWEKVEGGERRDLGPPVRDEPEDRAERLARPRSPIFWRAAPGASSMSAPIGAARPRREWAPMPPASPPCIG